VAQANELLAGDEGGGESTTTSTTEPETSPA
jgi:hypothetical protein